MIEPDTKDWTWVLGQPCPECGFEAAGLDPGDLGPAIRDNAVGWTAALGTDIVGVRPSPAVWSVTEYACHVRDVHRTFADRLRLMLDEHEPHFANWDQDAAAMEERYDLQDPAEVARELLEAAQQVAAMYDAVPADAWGRRGLRSNGSEFTVDSLGRYHLHDVVHHLWDVRAATAAATVAAYDAAAPAYRGGTQAMPASVQAAIDDFARALPVGARVLEIGSGPGRDARALEERGLSVRRTDITAGFVRLLREQGLAADVVDPLTDDLVDPERSGAPYDAVWASASLLHVARSDLPAVLSRLAGATRGGGRLRLSVKEGDGDGWSAHGKVRAPRHFVYWREQPLREALEATGWSVIRVGRRVGLRDESWLDVTATRR